MTEFVQKFLLNNTKFFQRLVNEKLAKGRGSEFSSGGMESKVQAAKLATSEGIITPEYAELPTTIPT